MGTMIDGVWRRDQDAAPTMNGGFVRPETVFRDHIQPGGRFTPERGRYHLYASLACPWAHRTLIMRRIKGLESLVGLSVTHWLMGDDGWTFADGPGVVPDPFAAAALYEIYARANSRYTGRVSVPVLWDKAERTIVSNESADIIRMFNSAFDSVGAKPGDYYPAALRSEIDALNARIYATVNNGVYRAGFAKTQPSYDEAVVALFETLGWLDAHLTHQSFLCGDQVTEADWRLFTTLVRFDHVYHGHFKCNVRRLIDYPALCKYVRTLSRVPGVGDTIDLHHITQHYYLSHPWIDPSGIVPAGPTFYCFGG